MIPKTELHLMLQCIHDVAAERGLPDGDVIAVALVGTLADIKAAIERNTGAITERGEENKQMAGDFLGLIQDALAPASPPASPELVSRLDALDQGFHNILDTLQDHAMKIAEIMQGSGDSAEDAES